MQEVRLTSKIAGEGGEWKSYWEHTESIVIIETQGEVEIALENLEVRCFPLDFHFWHDLTAQSTLERIGQVQHVRQLDSASKVSRVLHAQ